MMSAKHLFVLSIAATFFVRPQVALSISALARSDSTPRPPDAITTVRLHVHPKAEPQPALRYRFDFPFMEQRSGNAALQYSTAMSSLTDAKRSEPVADDLKLTDWLKAPPAELPIEDANRLVLRFSHAIEYAELAARSEQCDWQYPIRERGFGTLIPGLSDMRFLWRLLALKARLAANAGDIPEALRTLRIGFAMATDVGEAKLLIHNLVAIAGAAMMLDQIETLIQDPQAPNLYWALTDLPEPLIDFYHAVHVESDSLYGEFPELMTLDERVLSNDEVVGLWERLMVLTEDFYITPDSLLGPRLSQAANALKAYPEAKHWLGDQGLPAEEIDAMPVLYVVLRYEHYQFRCLRDDVCKWFSVPYWQAADGFEQAQDRIDTYSRETRPGGALANMLAAFGRIGYLRARFQRDLAILRCVEAIRIYGAAHDGQLPPSLDDITDVPVPQDPLYGRAFSYELRDGMAILESPTLPGHPLKDGIRYEITFE